MRERYLEAFDAIRIDCLNGDKYKTGKVAPDGSPDPSIFSIEGDPVGIQVGTAITTLVRKADHTSAEAVSFRQLWGRGKPASLLESVDVEPGTLYQDIEPVLPLGLPFAQTAVSEDWFDWPALPDLFPVRFHGVLTNRDAFLVDIDLDRLRARIDDYFDPSVSDTRIAQSYPAAMRNLSGSAASDASAVRGALLKRGRPIETGFVRCTYRPFDIRWLYWEADGGLLDRPRADYQPQVFPGNLWFSSSQHLRQGAMEPQTVFTKNFGSHHLIERGSNMFPAWLRDDGIGNDGGRSRRPNLSGSARRYLERLGVGVEDLFHYVLAVLHNPSYREANAGALRMEWPRIPLPGWPDGAAEGATAGLARSAARGRVLATLLDPDMLVPGVTQAPLHSEIASIAIPTTADERNMDGDDFALTAGWGHYGERDAVMPGQGRIVERAYTTVERAALGNALTALGKQTFDICLNGNAFWRNVPAAVWNYKLGGYQVLKKWLSYRERDVLDRALQPEEVQDFTDTARRIAAILQQVFEK